MSINKETQDALLEAINIITDNKLKDLKYNYYVDAVIKNINFNMAGNDTYDVECNGSIYEEIPSLQGKTFEVGDVVQILVKNGDWNKKFIDDKANHDIVPTLTPTINVSQNDDGITISITDENGNITTANITNGKSISQINNKYAVSNSNSTPPSNWSDEVQDTSLENKYLWNYEIITFTDSTTTNTDKRVIGVYTKDGKEIDDITEHYLISSNTNNIDINNPNWSTDIQITTPENKYLWNYETILYTDGTTWNSMPVIIGVQGTDGTNGINGKDGKDGRSISSVTEYYYATSASSNITVDTSGWTEEIQTITSTNKYLWNYEKITYSDNTNSTTIPCIIGTYGIDGKGISSVVNYYLATNSSTGITISSSGWTEEVQSVSSDKKYLWNYESVTFTDNTKSTTDPCIIGAYGKDGQNGVDGADGKTSYFHIMYSDTLNPTQSSQMTKTPSKYIGTYVDFTENDSTSPSKYTWTQFIGTDGANGVAGKNGIDGKTSYFHTAYANSADGTSGFSVSDSNNKSYIGVYVDFTQADSTTPSYYTWTLIKGKDGKDISQVSIQYYLSSSNTTLSNGSWATTPPAYIDGYYYWERSVTTFIDNTTSEGDAVLSKGLNEAIITAHTANTKATNTQTALENKVDKANIITAINASTEDGVSISGNKINLTGTVTANDYFKILTDGSMEARSGEIGGWIIKDDRLEGNFTDNANGINSKIHLKPPNSIVSGTGSAVLDLNVFKIWRERFVYQAGLDYNVPSGEFIEAFSVDGYGKLTARSIAVGEVAGNGSTIVPKLYISPSGTIDATSLTVTGTISTEGDISGLSGGFSDYVSVKLNGGQYYDTEDNICAISAGGSVGASGTFNGSGFNNTSLESTKRNISKLDNSNCMLEIVKDTDICKFNYKNEPKVYKQHYGFIIPDEGGNYSTPSAVLTQNGKSIDLYSMVSVLWKSVQELSSKVDEQDVIIKELQEQLAQQG